MSKQAAKHEAAQRSQAHIQLDHVPNRVERGACTHKQASVSQPAASNQQGIEPPRGHKQNRTTLTSCDAKVLCVLLLAFELGTRAVVKVCAQRTDTDRGRGSGRRRSAPNQAHEQKQSQPYWVWSS